MANLQQRHSSSRVGTQSGLSQDWDVVSEGFQDRLSTGSLSSVESDAVIIFGGRKGGRSAHSQSASTLRDSNGCYYSGLLNQNLNGQILGESDEDDRDSRSSEPLAWQQKHQRILSAVSDLASDPGLKHNEVYAEQTMTIEQRLLDQIAKLAEDLDESQEQAKLLLLQNDRLMTENDNLKKELQVQITSSNGGRAQEDDEKPDLVRVTIAMAAGIVIIGLAKKKLLFNGVGFVGAAMLGGCVSIYHLLQNNMQTKSDP